MSRTNLLGKIFAFLIVITGLTLLSLNAFEIYAGVSLYVNLLFALAGVVVCAQIKVGDFLYIGLLTAYLILCVFFADGGLGSVITFVTPLVMLVMFQNLDFSEKTAKFLCLFAAAGVLLLYANSLKYAGEGNYIEYSLTEINPNTFGMFTMFFFMIVSVCGNFRKLKGKLFLAALFVFAVLGMYNYESRGTTISLCCYLLLCIFPKKTFAKRRFVFLTVAVIAAGTVFPFVYLHLYESGYSMEVFGKTLYTGREMLWSRMFSLMRGDTFKMLFGMGSKTVLWENDLNVHNNFFNIIVNFGIVGYVVYYFFILKNIVRLSKYMAIPTVRKGLFMFLCSALVLGFTETTTLWSVIFSFVYFGLAVAGGECRKQENAQLPKKERLRSDFCKTERFVKKIQGDRLV